MRLRYYVGYNYPIRQVFSVRGKDLPSEITHPQFIAVVGPFRTKRGAYFMRDCGENNPHIQCVSDSERIVKLYKKNDNGWWTRI